MKEHEFTVDELNEHLELLETEIYLLEQEAVYQILEILKLEKELLSWQRLARTRF